MKAPSRFLQAAVALAIKAGEKILCIYPGAFRVGHREDGSPITAAHLASHHFLTEGLHTFNGGYPVLSEFSVQPSFEDRKDWETYWLVGPLDGGAEFIQHIDEFTVNIALIHRHKPVLGVVYAPALHTCYFAAECCGAFKQMNQDEPREIQVRMQAAEQPLVVASRSQHAADLELFLARLGGHDFTALGSSLKFCRVAEGQADLYPRIGPSSEWDTAAAQCIVECAGGAVTDLQGRTLGYNEKASLLNPYFLSFGDKTQNWRQAAETIEEPTMAPLIAPSPLLEAAVTLALSAGKKIMGIYASDFRVAKKEDSSPLTAADLASHHCLSEGLQALEGGYPVLSEESALLPFEERRGWETYWLIDPLDGTKEFIKRNGEFTVNIALIRNHKPVLGVVYAPALGVCYFAESGGGAFKQTGQDSPKAISVRNPAPDRLVVASSRSHRTPELELYLSRLGEHELISIGSSLKFCLVAEGAADLYPRIGLTSEWDTAAAQCVVETAGGAVTDLNGEPLRYNAKPSLLNPYFLVFGDRSRDWASYAEGPEFGHTEAGQMAA